MQPRTEPEKRVYAVLNFTQWMSRNDMAQALDKPHLTPKETRALVGLAKQGVVEVMILPYSKTKALYRRHENP